MKNMRWILALLVLSLSFAAETAADSFDGPLYTTYTPSYLDYIYMDPYLHFESTVSASTDARVLAGGPASDLQDDAIICEGDVTINSDADGRWARGGLYQFVDYWLSCEPPTYTSVSNNRPITWNSGYYDSLFPLEICSEGEPGCWGREGTLVRQRVDTYEIDPSRQFDDREGYTNVICKGVTTTRYGSTLLSTRVIGGAPYEGTVALSRGEYAISNEMAVDGCLGVLRFAGCTGEENHEKIFGRIRAESGSSAPGYSTSLNSVLNLRVVNNNDLRCQAEFLSIEPSPLEITPGGSTGITVTIRNTCDPSDPLCQDITVNRVTVSEGFRFTSISMPGTSFTARPGGTVTIGGSLTAPDDEAICTTIRRSVAFTVEYSCMGCEGMPGELSRTASYQLGYDCPDFVGRQPNLIPRFDPDMSRYDVPTGEHPNITIITRNIGDNDSNSGETHVSIGTLGPGLFDWEPADPSIPWETFYYPPLAPGEEEVHPRLSFTCTPEMENNTYTIMVGVDNAFETNESDEDDNYEMRAIRCVPTDMPPPGEGNETYTCEIAPPSYTGSPGGEYWFDLRCPDEGDPLGTCSGDVDWDVTERGNATYEDYSGNSVSMDVLVATDSGPGSIHVEAHVEYSDGNATCSSEIYIPVVPCEEYV